MKAEIVENGETFKLFWCFPWTTLIVSSSIQSAMKTLHCKRKCDLFEIAGDTVLCCRHTSVKELTFLTAKELTELAVSQKCVDYALSAMESTPTFTCEDGYTGVTIVILGVTLPNTVTTELHLYKVNSKGVVYLAVALNVADAFFETRKELGAFVEDAYRENLTAEPIANETIVPIRVNTPMLIEFDDANISTHSVVKKSAAEWCSHFSKSRVISAYDKKYRCFLSKVSDL